MPRHLKKINKFIHNIELEMHLFLLNKNNNKYLLQRRIARKKIGCNTATSLRQRLLKHKKMFDETTPGYN